MRAASIIVPTALNVAPERPDTSSKPWPSSMGKVRPCRRKPPGFPDIAAEEQSRRWIMLTVVLVVVVSWAFRGAAAMVVDGLQIRIRVQYVYGLLAAVTMLIVMGYGIRHKLPEVNAGHLRYWMQSHVYLSVVTFVLFAIHTGFRAGGVLSFLLAFCFYATLITGTLGWLLFQTAPKVITARSGTMRICMPTFRTSIRLLLEIGGRHGYQGGAASELRTFYQRVIRPTLELRRPEFRHYLRVGTMDKAVEDMMFEHIFHLLSEEDQQRLDGLRTLLNEKNEVLFQTAS